jgi:hypothetical protein
MDICQAELQLITTLSTMRNYNHDNTLNASVIAGFISPPLELTRKVASFGTRSETGFICSWNLTAEYYQSRVI